MVGGRPEDVETLFELARDKTVAGRRVLAATIGDLFFSRSEVLNDRERTLMADILRQLIQDVEASVRRALAEHLADNPDAPRELVFTLANDDIEVAHPLLVNSEALHDLELIEIIRNRTLEHQLAIALRKSLSEQVADALVASDNIDVIKTLLENSHAHISQSTLEYLVEQSRRHDCYQNPLLKRPELDSDLARRMYWWVSAALRSYILANYSIDPVALDDTMELSVQELVATERPELKPKAEELAEQLLDERVLTPQLMLQSLRQGEVPLFTAMFSKYTGVPLRLVRRMLFEPDGESLCIACKAAGMDKTTFASIFALSRKAHTGELAPPLESMAGVLGLFDRINPESATILLKKWQRDPNFLKAMWQVGQTRRSPGPSA